MRIVALSGPKFSGKDTAAKGLLELPINRTHNVFRLAKMAEGVKSICRETFGYTDEQLEDPRLKETKTSTWPFIEPRWPMMDIANWMRDHYGGEVWCHRWERITREMDPYWACHVMTDLRFPEELAMLRRLGGLIIYVHRESAEAELAVKQGAGNAMALNRSESHYKLIRDNADTIVYNDASIERLHAQIQGIVRNRFGYWREWDAERSPLQSFHTGEYDEG